MFDQIKAEPLHFYQSSCPPQLTAQINSQHQVTAVIRADQAHNQQHSTVIAISDDKNNLRPNVSGQWINGTQFSISHLIFQLHAEIIMPTLIDQIKPEIISPLPQQIIHQAPVENLPIQSSSTSRGSKPQACKVCGKVLSSASSYYVHMKLHSGTKPFQCTFFEFVEASYLLQ